MDLIGCYLVNNKFGRLLIVVNNDEIFFVVVIFVCDYILVVVEINIVVNIRNLNGFLFIWF